MKRLALIIVVCVLGCQEKTPGEFTGKLPSSFDSIVAKLRGADSAPAAEPEKCEATHDEAPASAEGPQEPARIFGSVADEIREAIHGDRQAAIDLADTLDGFDVLLESPRIKTTGQLFDAMVEAREILERRHNVQFGKVVERQLAIGKSQHDMTRSERDSIRGRFRALSKECRQAAR